VGIKKNAENSIIFTPPKGRELILGRTYLQLLPLFPPHFRVGQSGERVCISTLNCGKAGKVIQEEINSSPDPKGWESISDRLPF
jgi:hypothetical protein